MSGASVDVVVIGGGHNGLTAAAYLARAGLRALVLEARGVIGGRSVTEEFHPGFRASTLLHAAGPLLPAVERELELGKHGLTWLRGDVRLLALAPEGPGIAIFDDPVRTAAGLRARSTHDAEAYAGFAAATARIGGALGGIYDQAPPAIDKPGAADLFALFQLGRKLRGLGPREAYRVLRWGPMSAADLVSENFDDELLRAAIAARGIYAGSLGPRAPGTSAGLLLQAALDGHATAPAVVPRGGMGALAGALASSARSHGAEIRTAARVAHVLVEGGRAAGVVLTNGETIRARAVVANTDPRRTLLELVDAVVLGPSFVNKVKGFRARGTAAKLNLALSRLPRALAARPSAELSGRIHVGATLDTLERAADAVKYGEIAARPMLDVTIPTLLDPALAPAGAHVLSIHAQFAPHTLRQGDWTSRRTDLHAAIVNALAEHAPDLAQTIVGHQLLTPADLETEYGLTGGHLFHGEPSLDQLFTFRPIIGWARHRTPLAGLYLCGSGTHPGGPVTGACGRNASRVVLQDLRGR